MDELKLVWSVDQNNIYLDDESINDGELISIHFNNDASNWTKNKKIEVLKELVRELRFDD